MTFLAVRGIVSDGIMIPRLSMFFEKNFEKVGAYEKQKQGL